MELIQPLKIAINKKLCGFQLDNHHYRLIAPNSRMKNDRENRIQSSQMSLWQWNFRVFCVCVCVEWVKGERGVKGVKSAGTKEKRITFEHRNCILKYLDEYCRCMQLINTEILIFLIIIDLIGFPYACRVWNGRHSIFGQLNGDKTEHFSADIYI